MAAQLHELRPSNELEEIPSLLVKTNCLVTLKVHQETILFFELTIHTLCLSNFLQKINSKMTLLLCYLSFKYIYTYTAIASRKISTLLKSSKMNFVLTLPYVRIYVISLFHFFPFQFNARISKLIMRISVCRCRVPDKTN